jgi:hypothetical protein
MVEALVAIPFFIIIFASMVYIVRLYGEKQRTVRMAKEYAWTYAMKNCEGDPGKAEQGASSSPLDDAKSSDSNVDTKDLGTYNGASGADIFSRQSGSSKATVKGSVTASKAIGGYTNQLSTTTKVQCNEAPKDGDLKGVLGYAWSLTKW